MDIPEEATEKAARAITDIIWGKHEVVVASDRIAARAAINAYIEAVKEQP